MAASNKRSISERQEFDLAVQKQIDDDTYRMKVLQLDQSEDEVDQGFLQTASELGINVPQDPKNTLELVTSNVGAVDLDSAPVETPIQPLSRASQSIHTASDSSIEQQRHMKTPSLTATSITSASLSSASSRKSNYVKVREGFRRMSRLHRRKTLSADVPLVPPRASSMLRAVRPSIQPRPVTADQIPAIIPPQPHAITTDEMHALVIPQKHNKSIDYNPPLPPPPPPRQPTSPPPPPPEEEILANVTARRRSISNPVLKKLHHAHLQEQIRFITFEASQNHLMRTRQLQHKRNILAEYQQRQRDANARHTEALHNLEQRHLDAEVDLNRQLELERQACDTRLRHMQAYCNPRSTVQGMPDRVVTKNDYRQLEQQYHIRNGMDNLHASRINVLREKQGKQTERIMAKQEAELEALESEFERENDELDINFGEEERSLQQEFAERKKRLIRRWNLAELIERRKLELEKGVQYGPLPAVKWSHDSNESRERRDERTRGEIAPEVNMAYDAMNMI